MLQDIFYYSLFYHNGNTYEYYVKISGEAHYLSADYFSVVDGKISAYQGVFPSPEMEDIFMKTTTPDGRHQFTKNLSKEEFLQITALKFQVCF